MPFVEISSKCASPLLPRSLWAPGVTFQEDLMSDVLEDGFQWAFPGLVLTQLTSFPEAKVPFIWVDVRASGGHKDCKWFSCEQCAGFSAGKIKPRAQPPTPPLSSTALSSGLRGGWGVCFRRNKEPTGNILDELGKWAKTSGRIFWMATWTLPFIARIL